MWHICILNESLQVAPKSSPRSRRKCLIAVGVALSVGVGAAVGAAVGVGAAGLILSELDNPEALVSTTPPFEDHVATPFDPNTDSTRTPMSTTTTTALPTTTTTPNAKG